MNGGNTKARLRGSRSTPSESLHAKLLEDKSAELAHSRPESLHTFVYEWLESVGSDKESRCRSDSHLYRQSHDPVGRKLTGSAPEMADTRDTDGFVVPLMPPSTGTRSSQAATDTGLVPPSVVPSSGRSGRSLVESPSYQKANLLENNIYMRPPYEILPEQVAGLVDHVRRDRDSPGPSPDQVREDTDLADLKWMGAVEHEVERFFHANVFPYPALREVLKRNDRMPMSKDTVPTTESNFKVSNPAPDMLYGYFRDEAFTRAQNVLFNSKGGPMFANSQELVYPFLLCEFKGQGGSMQAAENQCLGGSAACVNLAERLNSQLRENEIRPINSAVFSLAINGREVQLYVSWKHHEQDYYTANIQGFLFQDPAHYIEFRRYVRNIIDWGKGKRLDEIRESLDSLVEERRKKTSEAAKSRPPPSDGSAAGGKRQKPSSRRNSNKSDSG